MRPSKSPWSVDRPIRGQRQEGLELIGGRNAVEQSSRAIEITGIERGLPQLTAQTRELFLRDRAEQLDGDLAAVVEHTLRMPYPLPDLRSRDLGRRGVFHE